MQLNGAQVFIGVDESNDGISWNPIGNEVFRNAPIANQEYEVKFTPTKNYIRIYTSTWTATVNISAPTEVYYDNFRINDGTTQPVTGGGLPNKIAFKYRIQDVTIGRFLSVDPKAHVLSSWSSYAAFADNPIIYLDPDGQYPISIHVRSFAPFDYFGPLNAWKGDGNNRSFTTNYAGSRLSMVTNYETTTQVANSTAFGAMSFSQYGAYGYSDAYFSGNKRTASSTGNNIDLHLYGKNEAFFPSSIPGGGSPGGRLSPTWDIDIHNNLSINATDGMLSISGSISGDQFPSAEAFVTDDFGTSIFLGTAPTSYGTFEGPVKQLAGDNKLPMIDVNVRIAVGEDGAFNGVYSTDADGNEIVMSPAAWNKKDENKSPVKQ